MLPSRCDSGFQGTECQPENPLPSTIMSDFENPDGLKTEWQEVIGGEIVKPEEGCGVISSGSSLYFNKVPTRNGRLRKACSNVGAKGTWWGYMTKKRKVAESSEQHEKCIKQHSCALQVKKQAIKRDRGLCGLCIQEIPPVMEGSKLPVCWEAHTFISS